MSRQKMWARARGQNVTAQRGLYSVGQWVPKARADGYKSPLELVKNINLKSSSENSV